MKPDIAGDLDPYAKPMLMKAVKDNGIHLLPNAAIQEFFPDGVTYKGYDKERRRDSGTAWL